MYPGRISSMWMRTEIWSCRWATGRSSSGAPVAFQEREGERIPVSARFALRDSNSGSEAYFELGDYDPARALVIDPVLSYSTYLGGSAADFGGYLQVDSGGKLYIAHSTAPDGAGLGASGTGVVVTKLDPVAAAVVFSTTLSGSYYDVVQGLAIGASGSGFASYITGFTASDDYPTCFSITDCAPHGGGRGRLRQRPERGGQRRLLAAPRRLGRRRGYGHRARRLRHHPHRRNDRFLRFPHDARRAQHGPARLVGRSFRTYSSRSSRWAASSSPRTWAEAARTWAARSRSGASGDVYVDRPDRVGRLPACERIPGDAAGHVRDTHRRVGWADPLLDHARRFRG
jgi:hypothetical protein